MLQNTFSKLIGTSLQHPLIRDGAETFWKMPHAGELCHIFFFRFSILFHIWTLLLFPLTFFSLLELSFKVCFGGPKTFWLGVDWIFSSILLKWLIYDSNSIFDQMTIQRHSPQPIQPTTIKNNSIRNHSIFDLLDCCGGGDETKLNFPVNYCIWYDLSVIQSLSVQPIWSNLNERN